MAFIIFMSPFRHFKNEAALVKQTNTESSNEKLKVGTEKYVKFLEKSCAVATYSLGVFTFCCKNRVYISRDFSSQETCLLYNWSGMLLLVSVVK